VGFEPTTPRMNHGNITTTPVYNHVKFLKLFNIYSSNIWHPRKKIQDPPLPLRLKRFDFAVIQMIPNLQQKRTEGVDHNHI
jgi:hypothetical protein